MSESGTTKRPTAADRLAHAERTEGDLLEMMHDVGGLIDDSGKLIRRWPRMTAANEILLDSLVVKYAKVMATAYTALADAVGVARHIRDLAAALTDDGPPEGDDFRLVIEALRRGPLAAQLVPDLSPHASAAVRTLLKKGLIVSVPSDVCGHCYVLTASGWQFALHGDTTAAPPTTSGGAA